ncbi:hypothetical protein BKA81DRAFT_43036 [Phyllosticta paracitricarpa]
MAQADPLLFLFAWSIVLFSFLGYGMGWTGTDWTGLGWAGLSKRASKQSKAKQISDASSFIMSLTSSSSSVVIIGNIFPLRFSCFFSQSTPTSLLSRLKDQVHYPRGNDILHTTWQRAHLFYPPSTDIFIV